MLHSSRWQFSLDRRYSSHNPEETCNDVKSGAFGVHGRKPPLPVHLFGKCPSDGLCFQNVGPLHPASPMHHKVALAPCSVPTCSGRNGLSRLLCERRKVQWCDLFHDAAPHVNLGHNPLSFDDFLKWLTSPNYAVMPTIPFKWNIASEKKNSPGKSHHCQISAEYPHWGSLKSRGRLVRCAAAITICTHLSVYIHHELWIGNHTVACVLWIDLSGLRRHACRMRSSSSLDVFGRPGNF
jgi:hypothetical protein